MYKGSVRLNYIGIDVSKAKLDCLWLKDPEKNKVKTKSIDNKAEGHQELYDWLLKQTGSEAQEIMVTLEATGIYHETLAYTLFQKGFQVAVVNPARPKEFAKSLGSQHKNDKKDSFILALYGYRMRPELWQPEAPEIRELKALSARLEALENDLQREENRYEKAEFNASSEVVMASLNTMIKSIKDEKERLEKEINDHIDRHPYLKKDRQLLESIPGVGPVISRLMLSVIHSRGFTKASQVAAYLGLIPIQNESGVFRGRSRLSKSGPAKIRGKLYMAAVVAGRWNLDIQLQQERLLQQGKHKMAALCAAMRKLVHICFGVIKHQTKYQPQAM